MRETCMEEIGFLFFDIRENTGILTDSAEKK